MAITCTNFDTWLTQWHEQIYKFTLMLSLNEKTAKELTFQAYLRLGAANPGMDEAQARGALYKAAFGVSRAYQQKKLRRSPSKKQLHKVCGKDMPEAFRTYLHSSFLSRAAVYLVHIAQFTPDEAGSILAVRPSKIRRLASITDINAIAAGCAAIKQSGDSLPSLSDRLYMRFSERSVAFETKMIDFKQRFDNIVPYLALAVLILCIIALIITQ